MTRLSLFVAATALLIAVVMSGCKPNFAGPPGQSKPEEVAAERAKLSPEDRVLVEAQEWCVISSDERLGSMGPPLKLDIKGQPVFVCCNSCRKKAEADPDKTLAKVAEFKARAKSEKQTPK